MPEIDSQIRRRQLLKALGATTGAAVLAGCAEGDTQGESGERVPTIEFHFYGMGGVYGDFAPLIRDNIEEMGFEVNLESDEFSGVTDDLLNNTRAFTFHTWGFPPTAPRLDPQEFTRIFAADYAGNDGNPNWLNYANCDYTENAIKQATASSRDEREEYVYNAQETLSNDIAMIPIVSYWYAGAGREDQVTLNRLGAQGINHHNNLFLIHSESDRETVNVGVQSDDIQVTNWLTTNSGGATYTLNHVPNSCLFEFTEDYELKNVIAKNRETSNEGKTVTVELRDGTFTNGDEITSEDVKFTFSHMEEHTADYPLVTEQGYSSIETPDDKTVIFNFEEPNPSFIGRHAALYGILHKDSWVEMGADQDPSAYAPLEKLDEWPTSGAFRIVGYSPGQQLTMEPRSRHPFYPEPDYNLNHVGYQEANSKANALAEGEIQIAWDLSPGIIRRLEGEDDDGIFTKVIEGWSPRQVMVQNDFSPGKFREFRKAVGEAMNRQEMNQIAYDGVLTEWFQVTYFGEDHPWHAPDDRLFSFDVPPEGDIEQARATLEEKGWSQDSDGNWHFPSDADLSPLWPDGEQPSPPDFPCLNEDGEYAGS